MAACGLSICAPKHNGIRLPANFTPSGPAVPTLYGRVVLGEFKSAPGHAAVVKVNSQALAARHVNTRGVAVVDDCKVEATVLMRCAEVNHPNLLGMHPLHATLDPAPGTIVTAMPFMSGGDLLDTIQDFRNRKLSIPMDRVAAWVVDIVQGVQCLHTRLGYAHLDISLENIVLEPRGEEVERAVVMDFGCAVPLKEDGTAVVSKRGKEFYMAPEVRRAKKGASMDPRQADVYSIGVVLFALLTQYLNVDNLAGVAFEFRDRFGQGRAALVAAMTSPNPAHRPTLDEVLAHPWLSRLSTSAPSPAAAAPTPRLAKVEAKTTCPGTKCTCWERVESKPACTPSSSSMKPGRDSARSAPERGNDVQEQHTVGARPFFPAGCGIPHGQEQHATVFAAGAPLAVGLNGVVQLKASRLW